MSPFGHFFRNLLLQILNILPHVPFTNPLHFFFWSLNRPRVPNFLSEFFHFFTWRVIRRVLYICELQTISIGIFERGIPTEILQNSTLNFNLVFSEYLQPYFTSKMRCISNKDFFKYGTCCFKVLSCIPDQGFVTSTTQIFCYKMLSDRNLFKIEVTPLAPHSISEEIFESLVLPYFRTVRHIHEDQKLNIHGLDCVISKSEPWNGLLSPDCHIEFTPMPSASSPSRTSDSSSRTA